MTHIEVRGLDVYIIDPRRVKWIPTESFAQDSKGTITFFVHFGPPPNYNPPPMFGLRVPGSH